MSQPQPQPQPQVITLDSKNSLEILTQYVEVAQKHGSFLLAESDILKRCKDVLLKQTPDTELNETAAKNIFIQAIAKGQSKGAYTLDDASILHKVCQFVAQSTTPQPLTSQTQTQQPTPQTQQQVQQVSNDTDLSSLSEPVPLRGPRVV